MMLAQFLADGDARKLASHGISLLRQSGIYGALFDVANQRNPPAAHSSPIDHAALRASWHDGYTEALRDLDEFFERYKGEKVSSQPARMDFGAAKGLLNQGKINQDEYNQLTGAKPTPK